MQHLTMNEVLWPWRIRVPIPMGAHPWTCSPFRGSSIPGRSQFYITFKPTPHLDKKHTVFGKLVGGEDVLDALEKVPVKPGTDRPAKTVKITEVIM
jgi:Cyclophilin type peptidyl-prolyl cis-trans isomerase/CLD